VEGELVVHFAECVVDEYAATAVLDELGLELKYFVRVPEIAVVRTEKGAECATMESLGKLEEIEGATLHYVKHVQ